MSKEIYGTSNEDSILKSTGPHKTNLISIPSVGRTQKPAKIQASSTEVVSKVQIFGTFIATGQNK